MSATTTEATSDRLYTRDLPTAAQLARRTSRWGWWFFTEHWLRSLRAYTRTVILESVLTPVLYLVATGIGLATLVNQGVGSVDGVNYLTFVSPAILVSTVMMSAANEGSYPVMGGFKWHRTYWGASASPLTPAQTATGHLVGMGLRLLLQAVVFWVVLVIGGATSGWWSWLMVPIGLVAGWAFGAPLTAFAATLKDDGLAFNFVFRFILAPMNLFAGTFYPLSSMPVYLQWIGWISPVWHGAQLARDVSYGAGEPAWLIIVHVVFLLACTAVGWALAARHYTTRLTS